MQHWLIGALQGLRLTKAKVVMYTQLAFNNDRVVQTLPIWLDTRYLGNDTILHDTNGKLLMLAVPQCCLQ